MSFFTFLAGVGKTLTGTGTPKAEELKKDLDSYNLGTENVQVSVEGDKVILKGQVKTQEDYEKAVLAVGNAKGISGVDTSGLTVAAASAGTPTFYTVKSGDNLSKIAEAVYGKGKASQYTAIFEANKPMLTHPDKIYPGQMLRIPPLK